MAEAFFRSDDGLKIITNQVLDDGGTFQTVSLYLNDDAATSRQIFWAWRAPTSLLPGSKRLFKYHTKRTFKSSGFKRIFKA